MKENNFEELEFLYKKYKPALLYYCMQFIRNKEDAIEIVHDVFIAVWNKREVLSLNHELRAYLYRSVHNKAINFIQKRKLQMQEMEEPPDAASQIADPFQVLQHKQVQELVFKLIEELPPRCKQVFILSRKEGMSYKEIAEIMEVTTKTVENQISIAIKFIKKGLEENIDKDSNDYQMIITFLLGFGLYSKDLFYFPTCSIV